MNRKELTTGTEWKLILAFALPLMLGNILQQLYNTVDGIVVGRFVSERTSALAALGSCGTLGNVFIAIAMGLSTGCSIVIAQFFGAKKDGEIRKTASTILWMLGALGLALTLIGLLASRFIFRDILGVTNEKTLDFAVLYFRIYSIGLIFQYLYNAVAAILRAVGDSRATLYFLLISAVTNVILDLLFAGVFGMGVAGVAIATVISQFICVAVSVIYMFAKYPVFRFSSASQLVFDKARCVLCMKLGVPTMVQQVVVQSGYLLLQRLVNSFGDVTMAAYMVGGKYESYLSISAMSLSMASSSFAGQNLGAGKPERISRAIKQVVPMSVLFVAVIVTSVYVFAPTLAGLFGVEGEELSRAVEYLRFTAPAFYIFAIYMPIMGMLQGCGQTLFTMLCSCLSLAIRTIGAYLLAHVFVIGYPACWESIFWGWTVVSLLLVWQFRRGTWKTRGIVNKQLGVD